MEGLGKSWGEGGLKILSLHWRGRRVWIFIHFYQKAVLPSGLQRHCYLIKSRKSLSVDLSMALTKEEKKRTTIKEMTYICQVQYATGFNHYSSLVSDFSVLQELHQRNLDECNQFIRPYLNLK